jgi:hypothetical protein
MEPTYAFLLYLIGCCLFYSFLLYHAAEDDEVTVGDAFNIMLVAFVPPVNVLAIIAIIRHGFTASGSEFSDRVLIQRKRK